MDERDGATRIYILIQSMVGRSDHLRDEIAGLDGVLDATPTSGRFDLIVEAEVAPDAGLLEAIEGHPGVATMLRCVVGNEARAGA